MYNGRICKGIKMIPFVLFLRVDTNEADLFCGKCFNRNKHVAHLCRECHCPTNESDNHLANHKAKTQNQIATLVLRKDKIGLKEMSQQFISNAYCDIQFGCHNKMGIHGACPIEMLHAIYLGVFIGCIMDNRRTHGATRTCLTNTPRDAELILDFEVILQFRSRLISLFL